MVTKIAYLTPFYCDDIRDAREDLRYLVNLAAGVAESSRGNCSIELACYGDASLERALSAGVNLRILSGVRTRPESPEVLSWELPEVIASADLVHVHQAFTRSSEMCLLLAKQQHKPICVSDYGGMQSTLGVQFDSLALADRLLCHTSYVASRLPGQRSAHVIPGGVDTRYFIPPAEYTCRDHILFCGRLVPESGIEQLISALPTELQLTVCGRAAGEDYFGHLRNLAGGKQVHFTPAQTLSSLRQHYQQAFAYVQPADSGADGNNLLPEHLGLTVLEAMACATPVISSRDGPLPEFVDDGETGFVFANVNELTQRLRGLANEPGLVERMGQRARLIAEQEYDLRKVGATLLAIYEGLLRDRSGMAA